MISLIRHKALFLGRIKYGSPNYAKATYKPIINNNKIIGKFMVANIGPIPKYCVNINAVYSPPFIYYSSIFPLNMRNKLP